MEAPICIWQGHGIILALRKKTLRELRNKGPSCIGQGHEFVPEIRKETARDLRNKGPSCTRQGHEVIPELRIKVPICIGHGHEVMLELCKEAPRRIGQGHEAIHTIRVLAASGRVMKLYQSYANHNKEKSRNFTIQRISLGRRTRNVYSYGSTDFHGGLHSRLHD